MRELTISVAPNRFSKDWAPRSVGWDDITRQLGNCKRIERAMGRRDAPEYGADGRRIYHDRPIDIDILLYGDERIDTPELQVPHPLMGHRDFILRPLGEIFEQK